MADIANNLFSWNSPCKVTPFDISRFGYPYMELVCNAYYIAAEEFQVVIEPGKEEIMLNDHRNYPESRHIYRQLEQMERAVAADIEKKMPTKRVEPER